MLKNQTNEIANSKSVQSDLGMGIMRLPGKVGYPVYMYHVYTILVLQQHEGNTGRSPTSSRRVPHENIEVSLGIDDLAGLSITNEASSGYEVFLMLLIIVTSYLLIFDRTNQQNQLRSGNISLHFGGNTNNACLSPDVTSIAL